ncbi:E3 ubiquitin-protein ligase MIB2-like isoform X5 [Lampetra planeri]
MQAGVRVVRGPGWSWQQQDGGEGGLGTLVAEGNWGTERSCGAVVQWDCGGRYKYRLGVNGHYDLRLYDNAQTGTQHLGVMCDGCGEKWIWGIRWKCRGCPDFDLCTSCYMGDKHSLSHAFNRITSPGSPSVQVPVRHMARKVPLKGIFPEAVVIRGADWKWGNQDGGEGGKGLVLTIKGWDSTSQRNAAQVRWRGEINSYRLGASGKMDLQLASPTSSGRHYYPDHLSCLGEGDSIEQGFCLGDTVRCGVDGQTLMVLQQEHGGFSVAMALIAARPGKVAGLIDNGDVLVVYSNGGKYIYNPKCLIKVYSVGDTVRIGNNKAEVERLQLGHGGWADPMTKTLGRVGRVVKVLPSGDLRVALGGHIWNFNPACVSTADPKSLDLAETSEDSAADPLAGLLMKLLLSHIIEGDDDDDDDDDDDKEEQADAAARSAARQSQPRVAAKELKPEQLISEAAQGNVGNVQKLVQLFPGQINAQQEGRTALHVAAHQGHIDVAQALLKAGASTEIGDDKGNTALHYAAHGNEAAMAGLLVSHRARVNSRNHAGRTALHLAARKGYGEVARTLCEHACDVNTQDSTKNSPIHDAIAENYEEVIEALASVKTLDLERQNESGFTPLQLAAFKGSKLAVQRILAKSPKLVDEQKSDGFAPLHLAAYNGRLDVVHILIKQGRSAVNARTCGGQTALMLAAGCGHVDVVFLLVREACKLDVEDEGGNTALHLVLKEADLFSKDCHLLQDDSTIVQILRDSGLFGAGSIYAGEALACFLVKEGANLRHTNARGKAPFDYILKPELRKTLTKLEKAYNGDEEAEEEIPKAKSQPVRDVKAKEDSDSTDEDDHSTIRKNRRYSSSSSSSSSEEDLNSERLGASKGKSQGLPTSDLLPTHWDHMSDYFKIVELHNGSSEFRKVSRMFLKTMEIKNAVIKRIKRVQNEELWLSFSSCTSTGGTFSRPYIKKNDEYPVDACGIIRRRQFMERRSSGEAVREMLLFHGTSKDMVEPICLQNFDWRMGGTHGNKYGKGCYFGRDARLAHRYASAGKAGGTTCHMFVVSVLVGRFTRGYSSYLRPPSRDDTKTNLYDSCVNDVNDPTIFVIFEGSQAYPEYIIQYRAD